MDILKKLFSAKQPAEEDSNQTPQFPNGLKKPWWFDEYEKDNESMGKLNTFNFRATLNNPNETQMHSHFESVIRDAMRQIENFDEQMRLLDEQNMITVPGFANTIDANQIDKEISPEQVLPLLKGGIDGSLNSFFYKSDSPIKNEDLSEYDRVMNILHGCVAPEEPTPKRGTFSSKPPGWHKHNFHGVPHSPHFPNDPNSSSFMYGKSVMTQIKRMPDGSYETQQTVRDADGTTRTTRSRTVDGKTEVLEKSVQDSTTGATIQPGAGAKANDHDSIFTIRNGYIMPKNMW